MAKEFILKKQGQSYVSDPVKPGASITIQVGFPMEHGLVKIETSFSPSDGWSRVAADNAPKAPMLYSKSLEVTRDTYVRIITNQLPMSAIYSVGGESGSDGSAGAGNVYERVESLDSITSPTEGVIYLVKNGDAGDNMYDEYIYTDSHFELLGGSSRTVTNGVVDALMEDAVTDEEISNLFK